MTYERSVDKAERSVDKAGVEPAPCCQDTPLKRARLPFRHSSKVRDRMSASFVR